MNSKKWTAIACLLGLVIAGFVADGASAKKRRRPLPLENHACGDSITHSFRLNNDLACVGGDMGLIANEPRVTIDLNGHTIRGEGGIRGVFIGAADVTLKNGTIRGFGLGIELFDGERATIARITAVDNTFSGVDLGGTSSRVVSSTFSANGGAGIAVTSAGATIRNNVVTNNGAEGIEVLDGPDGHTISGNTVSGNAAQGITVGGDNSSLVRNVITGNGHGATSEPGLELFTTASGNRSIANVLSGNSNDGYRDDGTAGNHASRNIARGNGFHQGAASGAGTGIEGTNASTGSGNIASGNDATDQCTPDFLCA